MIAAPARLAKSQKARRNSISRPGIISAASIAMTTATSIQGCTDQNFRVRASFSSEGKGRASRPSIFIKAGVGAWSGRRLDGFFPRFMPR